MGGIKGFPRLLRHTFPCFVSHAACDNFGTRSPRQMVVVMFFAPAKSKLWFRREKIVLCANLRAG